jgi:high-affinity K+ transport system ATPase subunit B
VLYGLVAMTDPPRPEAAQAIAAAQRAGIHPVMVTGDHPATARAIAARLGILDGRQVLTGTQLAQQGPRGLADGAADVAVCARTTPEQKLDIVEAWKARGDVVAMTGDGVNDAPALRRADIGGAMGQTGTEVAMDSARNPAAPARRRVPTASASRPGPATARDGRLGRGAAGLHRLVLGDRGYQARHQAQDPTTVSGASSAHS